MLPPSQRAAMAAQAEGAPGGPEPWLGSGCISKVERTGPGDRWNVGVGAEWRVVLGASLALGVVNCEERGDCGAGAGRGRRVPSWVKLGHGKFVELLETSRDTCRVRGLELRGEVWAEARRVASERPEVGWGH